jgi:hypothetical protein
VSPQVNLPTPTDCSELPMASYVINTGALVGGVIIHTYVGDDESESVRGTQRAQSPPITSRGASSSDMHLPRLRRIRFFFPSASSYDHMHPKL